MFSRWGSSKRGTVLWCSLTIITGDCGGEQRNEEDQVQSEKMGLLEPVLGSLWQDFSQGGAYDVFVPHVAKVGYFRRRVAFTDSGYSSTAHTSAPGLEFYVHVRRSREPGIYRSEFDYR